eukprot:4075517-Pleurochrysis_carterae.AAC.2
MAFAMQASALCTGDQIAGTSRRKVLDAIQQASAALAQFGARPCAAQTISAALFGASPNRIRGNMNLKVLLA